ncbi:MAG: hypothetical protein WCR92_06430 [Candidatus Cloacimonadaceae bacterium]|jgi:hypothetical protein
MEEVKTSFFNKQYKLRTKLECACDEAMSEIHDTLRKLIAEIPMKGFSEDGQRQISFDLKISLKGDAFGHSLKYEVA